MRMEYRIQVSLFIILTFIKILNTEKGQDTSNIIPFDGCKEKFRFLFKVSLTSKVCYDKKESSLGKCQDLCKENHCPCFYFNFGSKDCCLTNSTCEYLYDNFKIHGESILINPMVDLPSNCSKRMC